MIVKICFIDRVTFGQKVEDESELSRYVGEMSSRQKEQPMTNPQDGTISGIWRNMSIMEADLGETSCLRDNEKPE